MNVTNGFLSNGFKLFYVLQLLNRGHRNCDLSWLHAFYLPASCGLSLNLTISCISKLESQCHMQVICTPFLSSPQRFCWVFYILDVFITNFERFTFGRIASEDLFSLSRIQVPEKPFTEKKRNIISVLLQLKWILEFIWVQTQSCYFITEKGVLLGLCCGA